MDDDIDYEIECPFCGKRDIYCYFDCPNVIGTSDSNLRGWHPGFEALDDITWSHPDGGMGSGAYTVWIVRAAHHAAFRRELGEVRRRLSGMFHSRARA